MTNIIDLEMQILVISIGIIGALRPTLSKLYGVANAKNKNLPDSIILGYSIPNDGLLCVITCHVIYFSVLLGLMEVPIQDIHLAPGFVFYQLLAAPLAIWLVAMLWIAARTEKAQALKPKFDNSL